MTPHDYVLEAQHFYQADVDMAGHGQAYIFLTFPTMFEAAAWAHNMELESQVRLKSATGVEEKNFDKPVRVIYEF